MRSRRRRRHPVSPPRGESLRRDALGKILGGEAGGPLFQILASIVTTVHGPHYVPIECDFDQEGRTARLAVAAHFETESRPLTIPATDDEQRIAVRMPGGFEYKEAEVAQATLLSSRAEIKFDWRGTHSRCTLRRVARCRCHPERSRQADLWS